MSELTLHTKMCNVRIYVIHVYMKCDLSQLSYFPFGFEGRMWDLIVLVPDHCLSCCFTHSIVLLVQNDVTYDNVICPNICYKRYYDVLCPHLCCIRKYLMSRRIT